MKNGSHFMKTRLRFLVLLIICLATFADYYIYDIPAVLKSQIVSNFTPNYGEDAAEFVYSMLYTIYAIPNIILPLLGGVLTDKMGDRFMAVVYTFIIMVGQLLFCGGVTLGNAYLAIFGRFFFGIGGESLNICMTTLIIKWFQGNELSFSQGLNISILRVASIANAFFSPAISSKMGMQSAIYFGFVICGISVLFSLVLFWLDKMNHPTPHNPEITHGTEVERRINKQSFLQIAMSFPKIYWVLCTLTVFLYITVLSFNTFLSSIIIEEWLPSTNSLERNQEIAGGLMSVTFIISSLLFPIIGVLVDKIGMRIYFLMFSSILILASFVLFLNVYPFVPLILLGIAYSFFGAIVWPTIAYLVEEKNLGIGYGIITSFQNGGMGIAPLLVTLIKTKFDSNNMVIYFFILMGIMTLLLNFVFCYCDSQRKVSLNCNDQNRLLEELRESNNGHRGEEDEKQTMIGKRDSERETSV